jgi:dolichol-phosphate mannosyltransferase
MWAFRKSAYKAIEITAHTFELECNLFAQSVKKGFRMLEVPIDYARRGGVSKVQLMDGVKDCIFLLKERFRP